MAKLEPASSCPSWVNNEWVVQTCRSWLGRSYYRTGKRILEAFSIDGRDYVLCTRAEIVDDPGLYHCR